MRNASSSDIVLDLEGVRVNGRRYTVDTASEVVTGDGRRKPGVGTNDPHGEYGVLYTARDEYGTFIESFGQAGSISVTITALTRCGLASLSSQRPLKLVDPCAPGSLARIGADSRLFAGERESRNSGRALFMNIPTRRMASSIPPDTTTTAPPSRCSIVLRSSAS